MNKRLELEKALSELDDVNFKLRELSGKSHVYTNYTIEYAKAFLDSKKSVEGLKTPSDELTKHYTLSKPHMRLHLEEYNAVKFETEVYLALSKNLQAKIFALNGYIKDEKQTENLL